MSNSVFLKPDENGNWGTVNQGGVDQTSALKSYTLQSGATALGNGTFADVSGYTTFVANVVISGTATVTWEVSSDNTFPANLTSTILARPSGSTGNATTTAAVTGIFILNVSGMKYLRARISAYSSGTVDVTATASTGATIWYPTTSGFGGSDALATSSLLQGVGSFNLLFNGSTWDRVRNNLSNSTLSSAARTSTTNSADQNNYNHRGAIFFLNVTAASGTGGLQLVVQVKDNIESSNYKTITTAPTAVTAVGQYVYVIYPSADNVNGAVQQVASQPLPRSFRVQVIHGDSSSYTYTVAQQLIL